VGIISSKSISSNLSIFCSIAIFLFSALSFIEKNDGDYTVCVYPEYSRLTDRCLPKYLQSEVSSIVFVHISFPLSVERISQHYLH